MCYASTAFIQLRSEKLICKKNREKKKFMPELELEGLKGLLGFQLIEQADSPRYGRM